MAHTVRVKVSGSFACFSRPEAKVERLSYECLTPSAARGILDSILWKPEMRWIVRRISILNEIKFVALKRNEVQSKVAPSAIGKWMKDNSTYRPFSAGAGSEEGTPRNTLALRDVAYIIEAEPHVFNANSDNTPVKYMAMFNRRVEKGQAHAQPCFGCREFAAQFEPPIEADTPLDDSRDLGVMLYDILYDPKRDLRRPLFFRAKLTHGVLDTRPEHVLDAPTQKEVLTCSYKR
ncbi:MAG: type I-C CRISPR-associated protein Cas5c [Planctomycetota bacterium]